MSAVCGDLLGITCVMMPSGFAVVAAPVTPPAPSGGGAGVPVRIASRRVREPEAIQLAGELMIATVGVGELRIVIDEDLAAHLRNIAALAMINEFALAEIAAAAVNSHRVAGVRHALTLGDAAIVAAAVEAAIDGAQAAPWTR